MTVEGHSEGSAHVLKTPLWVMVVRGAQLLLSLIIVGLAGTLSHDAYLDVNGFAIAVAVLSWPALAYIILSEKLPSLHHLYHVIAVLVLDGFFMIMWLAAFAAVAAERARYVYNVSVSSCSDDGSLIDSKTCVRKRGVILFKSGMAMMAATAGLGALVWLLFVATFVWGMVMFFRGRKEGRFLFNAKPDEHQLENQQPFMGAGAQGEKVAGPQQPQAPGPYQPSSTPAPQYPPQGQYPQGQYPQDQYPQGQYPQAGYQPPVSPQSQYQSPSNPPQELPQPQPYEPYGQYPPQQGYQGQQAQYSQHTGAPHSELDGQGQPYNPAASQPTHRQ